MLYYQMNISEHLVARIKFLADQIKNNQTPDLNPSHFYQLFGYFQPFVNQLDVYQEDIQFRSNLQRLLRCYEYCKTHNIIKPKRKIQYLNSLLFSNNQSQLELGDKETNEMLQKYMSGNILSSFLYFRKNRNDQIYQLIGDISKNKAAIIAGLNTGGCYMYKIYNPIQYDIEGDNHALKDLIQKQLMSRSSVTYQVFNYCEDKMLARFSILPFKQQSPLFYSKIKKEANRKVYELYQYDLFRVDEYGNVQLYKVTQHQQFYNCLQKRIAINQTLKTKANSIEGDIQHFFGFRQTQKI